MSTSNTSLNDARIAKNDEFYTQLGDIEKEMVYYWDHFRGKVIYCNCDDPTVSNFYRYFERKFKDLGLKKLITTCYKNEQPDLFSKHDSERAVCVVLDGGGQAPYFPAKGRWRLPFTGMHRNYAGG